MEEFHSLSEQQETPLRPLRAPSPGGAPESRLAGFVRRLVQGGDTASLLEDALRHVGGDLPPSVASAVAAFLVETLSQGSEPRLSHRLAAAVLQSAPDRALVDAAVGSLSSLSPPQFTEDEFGLLGELLEIGEFPPCLVERSLGAAEEQWGRDGVARFVAGLAQSGLPLGSGESARLGDLCARIDPGDPHFAGAALSPLFAPAEPYELFCQLVTLLPKQHLAKGTARVLQRFADEHHPDFAEILADTSLAAVVLREISSDRGIQEHWDLLAAIAGVSEAARDLLLASGIVEVVRNQSAEGRWRESALGVYLRLLSWRGKCPFVGEFVEEALALLEDCPSRFLTDSFMAALGVIVEAVSSGELECSPEEVMEVAECCQQGSDTRRV